MKKEADKVELTRRCDYACRILRSAYRHRDRFVSVAEISEEEEIPYAFARTIQHDLVQAGYVRTVRGAHGGLQLAIDLSQVTVLDVLHALQGEVTVSACAADPQSCPKSEGCRFSQLWQVADKMLNTLFDSVTLSDMFESTSSNIPASTIEAADEAVRTSLDELLDGRAPTSCAATCN